MFRKRKHREGAAAIQHGQAVAQRMEWYRRLGYDEARISNGEPEIHLFRASEDDK